MTNTIMCRLISVFANNYIKKKINENWSKHVKTVMIYCYTLFKVLIMQRDARGAHTDE